MGGLRSRILRTLQSFPNAAAQSNVLLALPPGAGPSPEPPVTPCGHRQEPAPQEEVPADEAVDARELPGGGADDDGDKENVSPGVNPRKAKKMKLSSDHQDDTCYRRPDLASATLFDPDLLAAFRLAVDTYAQALEVSKRRDDDDDHGDGVPVGGDGEGGGGGGAGVADPLEAFERRCPPGGERAVVLYTTSLRGVRKTFEDCARVRRLLEGLRVAFLERDVSMHAPYREELRAMLCGQDGGGGDPPPAFPVPPRLFVDGRYLGGADEVVALHERSQLRPVLRRAPRRGAGEGPCAVCGGAWFVVCGGCSGSHWLHDAGGATVTPAGRVACSACNENGLVPCPLCS
ncbi:hypothetical protein SETIT_9G154800v2 [Setaria italica]|uniref:Glutaredoxin domain-containing protein n=1 Tax=Setaria italica TaxID=4555 RepID=K4AI91_SETIT|nr:uncharacterized protein LOC101775789 [Setaria italica]RCV41666.1 hypothetical protein SETIT_9G154800v2 [Setaria italica]